MHQWQSAYFLGIVGYGHDEFSTKRNIHIGTIQGAARGSYGGNEFISYVENGLNLPVRSWTLQPLAALRYLLLAQEGFNETGVPGANLNVDGATYDSLRYSFGARATRSYTTQWGVVSPYLQGRWTHEVLDNQRLVDANFAGVVGGSFVAQGNVLGRDFGEFGVGVSTNFTEQVSFYTGYDAQVSTRQNAHGLIGGFQFCW
jgi:outer membrane autotransporter protein